MIDGQLEMELSQDRPHYEYRARRWWVCSQLQCDLIHHFYRRIDL